MLAYHNVANPFDVDASGIVDSTDAFLVDSEIKSDGERVLSNPNGPVNHFWDVNGDSRITYDDGYDIVVHLNAARDKSAGHQDSSPSVGQLEFYANFWEFMRVSFDGFRPSGDEVDGSRCSNVDPWHSMTSIVWNATTEKWERSANGRNEIGAGHEVIGDLP